MSLFKTRPPQMPLSSEHVITFKIVSSWFNHKTSTYICGIYLGNHTHQSDGKSIFLPTNTNKYSSPLVQYEKKYYLQNLKENPTHLEPGHPDCRE